MSIFIGILILITCILLILIVLVQNSKGGGLASNFSSSGQVMGVRKTADFLEKSTWTLIAAQTHAETNMYWHKLRCPKKPQ